MAVAADFSVSRTAPETASVSGDYGAAFQGMRVVLEQHGGKVKKESLADGYIEARFRYGVNPWGLRIAAQFRDTGAGNYEVRVNGHFKDAFDSTGAAKERAIGVLDDFASFELAGSSAASPVAPPKVGSPTSTHRGKSKTAAALLALIVGGLGVHKFYLGSWGWGLIFLGVLLLSGGALVYIPAIVGLVEAIRFFFMSRKDFDARYNLASAAPMKW